MQMRHISTAIILTMLAQPVWALWPKESCKDLEYLAHTEVFTRAENYKKMQNGCFDNNAQGLDTQKVCKEFSSLEDSSIARALSYAKLFTAFCKE